MKKFFLTQIVAFGLAVMLGALPMIPANAISNIDRKYIYTPFYDPAFSPQCNGTGVGFGGNIDRFLQVLAKQESGGKVDAQNPSSSASGKYQYIDSVWSSRASLYGPAALYAEAKSAPEEIQDAVAYLEYLQKFQQFNSDLYLTAMSHMSPAAAAGDIDPTVPIPPNTISPAEYAQKVVGSIEAGEATDIPLLYTAAPDFNEWLAKVNTGDIQQQPLYSSNCAGGIPSGEFVYYSQSDSDWARYPYGSGPGASNLTISGCGPTSVAMVVATLADSSVTPVQVADFGTQNGSYVPREGTLHQEMLIEGPENWGLTSTSIGTNMDAAIQTVRAGGLVIVSGSGPIPFTAGGHILVIRGVTDAGKLLLGDPGHKNANNIEWNIDDLTPYIKAMYAVTK